jgi:ADP-heptose:LPS heptosyltransferase
MPSKLWPEERFREVLDQLIARFDVWPVVFGGPEDRDAGNRLVAAWGRGFVAAGALGLRPSASALARCVLHVGNDTGTTHMAAAVGVPCVAVYSSRSKPGVWYPYGQGHRIHRTPIDCEGCELITCVDREMECILRIDAQAVTRSCIEVLDRRLTKAR